MRALVYKEPFEMELKNIPPPKREHGEILVGIKAVGVCGSDIHGFSGATGRRYPGMVMGHEIAGEIVETDGSTLSLKSKGRKCVIQPIIYCNQCELCKLGKTNICLNKRMVGVNMDLVGGLTEYISVPEKNVFVIDDKIPFHVATLVEPFAVGEGATVQGELKGGETVCIIGSGTIGLATLQMVLMRKPAAVFIVDKNARKLELAEKFGAIPVNFLTTDPVEFIINQTGGRGVDVSFEAVGMSASVNTAQKVTKTGGRIVWVGNSEKHVQVDMQDMVIAAKTIVGTYSYNDTDFTAALGFVEDHLDIVEMFAEDQVSMEDAKSLYSSLAKGEKDLLRGIVNI